MKTLLYALFIISVSTTAQTKIEKTIPVKSGQKLVLQLDHPQVKLQTWDKAEVQITGTVSINQGEHDSAFGLDVNVTSSEITVVSGLKDKENIPHRISIKKGDREYFFKTGDFHDPEVQKWLADNGNDYSFRSSGVIQDIKLTVFIPRSTPVVVNSKYGIVEVSNFEAPLTIDSKYGGADITFLPQFSGQITARSQYGEILTNLDTKFDRAGDMGGRKGKHWMEISAKLGSGPVVSVESKYGNIYLRKSK